MLLPELAWLVDHEQLIVRVCKLGRVKRLVPCDEEEQNDSGGEHIHLLPRITLTEMDLWSHEAQGALDRRVLARAIVTRSGPRETEIRNFKCVLVVKEQVLGLEVAMHDALSVAVLQALQQLTEEVSRHRLF